MNFNVSSYVNVLVLFIPFLIFLLHFVPWISKLVLCAFIKRVTKLDVKFIQLGFNNALLSVSRDSNCIVIIKLLNVGVRCHLWGGKSRTLLTVSCEEMSLQELQLEEAARGGRSSGRKASSRRQWLYSLLRLVSVHCQRVALGLRIGGREGALLWVAARDADLSTLHDDGRFSSQVRIDTLDAKLICPAADREDDLTVLANLRTSLSLEVVSYCHGLHKLHLAVGATRCSVLEEVFSEMARFIDHRIFTKEPKTDIIPASGSDQKQHQSGSRLKELGLEMEQLELNLLHSDVAKNLTLCWTKTYASLLRPDRSQTPTASVASSSNISGDGNSCEEPPPLSTKFKTGCYGLRVQGALCGPSAGSSWRRLELGGHLSSTSGFWLRCRLDNPSLVLDIAELRGWRDWLLQARSLLQPVRHCRPATNPTNRHLLAGLHCALKLEVNCSHRGQTINSDSLALLQIVSASAQQPGLELGLKTLVASYEADTPDSDVDKLIESIDLYSDINTAYCRLLPVSEASPCGSSITSNSGGRWCEHVDYYHRWGTVLFAGNVFCWLHRNKAGCLMNQVQVELSSQLVSAVTRLVGEMAWLRQAASSRHVPAAAAAATVSSNRWAVVGQMDLEMKLEHVDLFAVSDQLGLPSSAAFVRHKMSVVQITKSSRDYVEASLKACRLSYDVMRRCGELYACAVQPEGPISSSETIICELEQLRLEYLVSRRALSCFCERPLLLSWSPRLHLCLVQAATNATQLRTVLSSLSRSDTQHTTGHQHHCTNVYLELQAGLGIVCELASPAHAAAIECDCATLLVSKHRSKMTATAVRFLCDGHSILSFTNFSWREIVPTNKYRQDKEKLRLHDAFNQAWEIQADRVLLSFPYLYNFHECYSEIVSIRKFLRLTHNKTPGATSSTLSTEDGGSTKPLSIPPDLIVYFKEFQLEIKDDPLECKLLDNYLVLRDECEEHDKRVVRMRNQLKKLAKTGRSFKDAEYQRCLSQLDLQKQAQYIARISSLRHTGSSDDQATTAASSSESGGGGNNQHNLMRWTVTNLSLMSLSDSGFVGVHNAVQHMRNIDPDSPYPEGGLEFSTLWCRMVSLNAELWTVQMRDYMRPFWEMKDLYVWGRLILAEQSASLLAKRRVRVEVGIPWNDVAIERSSTTIKFFHDFSADMREHSLCYGPNWEPCMQWINTCLERVTKPSRDPSPSLPWWDKSRLRLHGRLYFLADAMHWLYATSLNPYNSTEFFHWTWTDIRLSWENMKWILEGNLDIFCRSASKYDGDCQLLHWPNLCLKISIDWLCDGDHNDHFSVQPVIAQHISDPAHDTYRLFRSRNVNLTIDFREASPSPTEYPRCVFYTNILKFFDKFKNCVRKVARPIRRGRQFQYFRKKKTPLGRHYKFIQVKMSLPQLSLVYWVSLAKKTGVHMMTGPLSLGATFFLEQKPYEGGLLRRRPASVWSIMYMRAQMRAARVWLVQQGDDIATTDLDNKDVFNDKNRYEFIILSTLRYDRISDSKKNDFQMSYNSSILNDSNDGQQDFDLLPKHNLRLVDLKVRWTETNRNLVYAMMDIYRHKTQLRKNLSAQALKSIQLQPVLGTSAAAPPGSGHPTAHNRRLQQHGTGISSIPAERFGSDSNLEPGGGFGSGVTRKGHARKRSLSANCVPAASHQPLPPPPGAGSMLEQLVREVDTARLYAYCDEEPRLGDVLDKLTGSKLASSTDKTARHWHIELVNSQVLLKTKQLSAGYVIVSAALARLDSYEYLPLWKDSQLLTKSSICGKLECMQYYATVGKLSPHTGQQWLSTCDVEDQDTNEDVLSGTPAVVGCGKAVGGVVGGHVGLTGTPEDGAPVVTLSGEEDGTLDTTSTATAAEAAPSAGPRSRQKAPNSSRSHPQSVLAANSGVQLQRMISKCSCRVYYISYDLADPNTLPQHLIPPLPLEEDEVTHSTEGATTLTIVHSNLNVVTNSLQYHMIVDIINDLILYVEPQRKARDDRNKVEFSLLSEDQLKVTILSSQETLRNLVLYQMRLERELWKMGSLEGQAHRIRLLENSIKQIKNEIEQKNSALSQCIVIYQQLRVQSQKRDLHIRSQSAASSVVPTSGASASSHLGALSSHTSNAGAGPVTGAAATAVVVAVVNPADISKEQQTGGSSSGAGGGIDTATGGSTVRSSAAAEVVRRNEVCFEHATWRMTEHDGQIGLCDVELRGFVYAKVTRDDDSGSHCFQLNTVKVESLGGSVFREVLMADHDSALGVGGPVLRVNLVERAPVGGIKVNEAMEICIAPLVLQISKQFYSTMVPFFFPGKSGSGGLELADGGSDNGSFVKSESMDAVGEQLQAATDRSHPEMLSCELDQLLLLESTGIVAAGQASLDTGLITRPSRLASSMGAGSKARSGSQQVQQQLLLLPSPTTSSSTTGTDGVVFHAEEITPTAATVGCGRMNMSAVEENSGESRPSLNSSSNLKIEDVLNNQHQTMDYLYQCETAGRSLPPVESGQNLAALSGAPSVGTAATVNASPLRQQQHPGRTPAHHRSTASSGAILMAAPITTASAIGASATSAFASGQDPLQLMAERAKQNSMFLYVKIHGFPIRLSYRGEKQNALSINNTALNLTAIEYHNKLWTWLDFMMEVKKSMYRELKIEFFKQKFKLAKNPLSRMYNYNFNPKLKEEDREKKKLEMLLGVHALPKEASKKKTSLLKRYISKK